MESKQKYLFGTFLLSLIMLVGLVSATITINTPTASEVVSGSYVFNATNTMAQVMNCSFETDADGNFSIVLNVSDAQTEFTTTNNSALLTDASSTTLIVACTNLSNDQESNTVSFTIDNTVPTCSYSIPIGEDILKYLDPVGIYPVDASTDAIDSSLTYSWVLYDPSLGSQDTSTSSTPNFVSEDFDEIGTFTLGLTVTDDGSNSAVCTNQTIDVRGSDGNEAEVIISVIRENKSPIILGAIVIVLIIVGVGAYFVIKENK